MKISQRLRAAVGAGAILSGLTLAACGGGGSAPTPVVVTTTSPTSAPTTTPTSGPATKQFAGAPLSSTPALSLVRRNGQSVNTITGLPTLIESSGMVAEYGGTNVVWVHDTSTNADVAETSITVTSPSIAINNPAPEAQNCAGIVSGWCAVHPLGWEWGTSSTNGKPVGKQTLTVTAGDGTTGTMPDYVYDGWIVACNGGVTYTSGAPAAGGTATTADWYADCVKDVVDFPHGAQVIGGPVLDSFGRQDPYMTTIMSAAVTAPITSVAMANVGGGQVYAVKLGDGGIAKVLFESGAGVAVNSAEGLSLHDSPSGSGTFAF